MPKYIICKARDHKTWQCPLVDNVNRSPALARRIKQARLQDKQKISNKHAKNQAYRLGPDARMPTPRHTALPAIPPPTVTAIMAEQRAAHQASLCSSVKPVATPSYGYGKMLDRRDHAHIAGLGQLIDTTVGSTFEDVTISILITAAAQTDTPHDGCAIPIHAEYEEELHQADCTAFMEGSYLN